MLTYQGEEMEEDEETMADYDIQVERNYIHVLKLCPPKSWSRTKSSKCKKKTFAGRFDHPAPAQAGQWLHHPPQQVFMFIVIYFFLLKTKMCSA